MKTLLLTATTAIALLSAAVVANANTARGTAEITETVYTDDGKNQTETTTSWTADNNSIVTITADETGHGDFTQLSSDKQGHSQLIGGDFTAAGSEKAKADITNIGEYRWGGGTDPATGTATFTLNDDYSLSISEEITQVKWDGDVKTTTVTDVEFHGEITGN